MSRICTVCNHPKRAEIEGAIIIKSGSIRSIADRFDISFSSLNRHLKGHLPEKISKAAAENQLIEVENITDSIRDQIKRSKKIFEKADKAENLKVSLMAIREEREGTKILAQMAGEIPDNPSIILNNLTDEEVERRAREILSKRQ